MKIEVKKIYDISSNRPQGYIEDIMSYGTLDESGAWLEMSEADWNMLRSKYRKEEAEEKRYEDAFLRQIYGIDELKHDQIGILQKAQNLIGSVVDWSKSGFKISDQDLLKTRLAVCNDCEFWDAAGFGGTGRCKKCGCSTQAKLRMASEKCPIGKW